MQILRRSAKAKSDQQDVIRGIRQTPENVKFLDESAISPAGDGSGEDTVGNTSVRKSDTKARVRSHRVMTRV